MSVMTMGQSKTNDAIRLWQDIYGTISICGQAVQSSDIKVPDEKLEETVSYLVGAHYQRMKYDSMFAGKMFMPSSDELEEQAQLIRKQAYLDLKTELVLQQIAEAEGLVVTSAELEEEAAGIAERQGLTLAMVKDFLGDDHLPLQQDLLLRKAADFVYKHAVFI